MKHEAQKSNKLGILWILFKGIIFIFPLWLTHSWLWLDKHLFIGKKFPEAIINLSFWGCVIAFICFFFNETSKAKLGGFVTASLLLVYIVFASLVLFVLGWSALTELYGP